MPSTCTNVLWFVYFQSGFNFGLGGGGGMPGIGALLNNPAMMQMAQQMMSNPDMQNM